MLQRISDRPESAFVFLPRFFGAGVTAARPIGALLLADISAGGIETEEGLTAAAAAAGASATSTISNRLHSKTAVAHDPREQPLLSRRNLSKLRFNGISGPVTCSQYFFIGGILWRNFST